MFTTRKTYTEEFKREAVALVEQSVNWSQVALDLGIHVSLLKKWRKKITNNLDRPFPGRGHAQDEESHRFKKENARLKEEVEILKKAVGISGNRPSARFRFIEDHRDQHSIVLMCRVLKVSKSGFYLRRKNPGNSKERET